jgi:uncharacterized protein with HEPN domain
VRDDRLRLSDILEAINRIERYAARGKASFLQDELLQTWVIHHILLIGEAARGVSETVRNAHPEVPWSPILGMRNIVVHHYFQVDHELVWNVVASELPPLKAQISAILSEVDPMP